MIGHFGAVRCYHLTALNFPFQVEMTGRSHVRALLISLELKPFLGEKPQASIYHLGAVPANDLLRIQPQILAHRLAGQ